MPSQANLYDPYAFLRANSFSWSAPDKGGANELYKYLETHGAVPQALPPATSGQLQKPAFGSQELRPFEAQGISGGESALNRMLLRYGNLPRPDQNAIINPDVGAPVVDTPWNPTKPKNQTNPTAPPRAM